MAQFVGAGLGDIVRAADAVQEHQGRLIVGVVAAAPDADIGDAAAVAGIDRIAVLVGLAGHQDVADIGPEARRLLGRHIDVVGGEILRQALPGLGDVVQLARGKDAVLAVRVVGAHVQRVGRAVPNGAGNDMTVHVQVYGAPGARPGVQGEGHSLSDLFGQRALAAGAFGFHVAIRDDRIFVEHAAGRIDAQIGQIGLGEVEAVQPIQSPLPGRR